MCAVWLKDYIFWKAKLEEQQQEGKSGVILRRVLAITFRLVVLSKNRALEIDVNRKQKLWTRRLDLAIIHPTLNCIECHQTTKGETKKKKCKNSDSLLKLSV